MTGKRQIKKTKVEDWEKDGFASFSPSTLRMKRVKKSFSFFFPLPLWLTSPSRFSFEDKWQMLKTDKRTAFFLILIPYSLWKSWVKRSLPFCLLFLSVWPKTLKRIAPPDFHLRSKDKSGRLRQSWRTGSPSLWIKKIKRFSSLSPLPLWKTKDLNRAALLDIHRKDKSGRLREGQQPFLFSFLLFSGKKRGKRSLSPFSLWKTKQTVERTVFLDIHWKDKSGRVRKEHLLFLFSSPLLSGKPKCSGLIPSPSFSSPSLEDQRLEKDSLTRHTLKGQKWKSEKMTVAFPLLFPSSF